MGELPLHTIKAHVFEIDPETKKRWLPSCEHPVDVSFYHDTKRGLYRVISLDGEKVLINSTLLPDMCFTKTSQKFGQWTDVTANTIYGLGFTSEDELNDFIQNFDHYRVKFELDLARDCQKETGDPLVDQLRYENDRLKIALAQSSSNARKWEMELQVLRNTNERLTTAIQESSTNVDKWNKQLTSLKEENAKLKLKVLETEKTSNTCGSLENQLNGVISRLQLAEKLLSEKDMELVELKMKIDSLQNVDVLNKRTKVQCQIAEEENSKLKGDILTLHEKLELVNLNKEGRMQEVKQLQLKFSAKVAELLEISEKITDIL